MNAQELLVRVETWKKQIRTFSRGELMPLREHAGVSLEQVNAEQLASKGWFMGGHSEESSRLETNQLPANSVPMPEPMLVARLADNEQEHPIHSAG